MCIDPEEGRDGRYTGKYDVGLSSLWTGWHTGETLALGICIAALRARLSTLPKDETEDHQP